MFQIRKVSITWKHLETGNPWCSRRRGRRGRWRNRVGTRSGSSTWAGLPPLRSLAMLDASSGVKAEATKLGSADVDYDAAVPVAVRAAPTGGDHQDVVGAEGHLVDASLA